MKLSYVQISKAKGPAVLHDGGGLYLRVSNNGAKSWIYRFQLHGKRRDMGLGRFPDVSLAEARKRAAGHRSQRQGGTDPIVAREAERQQRRLATARGKTFREAAEEYIAAHEAGWRNAKHRAQWRQTLAAYVYPIIGHLPVAEIDLTLVLKVLEGMWSERTELAARLRGRMELVLDAATVRGYRQGPNPAQWKGNLAHILPSRGKLHQVEHHPALPFEEVPAFLADLRRQGGAAARGLEFLILTAARTGEVCGATWTEFDLSSRVWAIPPERMKMRRDHRVPLSDAALAVIERARPYSLLGGGTIDPAGPVFPGISPIRPMSDSAMRAVLRRMGRGDFVIHGFRSSFASWAAECTNFQYEVREMALAHNVGNAVERAYQRSDLFERRRRLMDDWAHFCDSHRMAGKVVQLHV